MGRQWQEVTAIYVIGNQTPVATFATESQGVAWAEQAWPGEWIKKRVKIPHLPLTPKAASKNLKNVAHLLDRLDWDADADDRTPGGVIIEPE